MLRCILGLHAYDLMVLKPDRVALACIECHHETPGIAVFALQGKKEVTGSRVAATVSDKAVGGRLGLSTTTP